MNPWTDKKKRVQEGFKRDGRVKMMERGLDVGGWRLGREGEGREGHIQ